MSKYVRRAVIFLFVFSLVDGGDISGAVSSVKQFFHQLQAPYPRTQKHQVPDE